MQTQIELPAAKQAPAATFSRLIRVTPLAILISAIANLALYWAAGTLFPEVTAWPGAGPGQIIGANVVYLLIGAVVFAITTRFSSQPARHYRIVASVGLLLSLALPISAGFGQPGLPPAELATVITLSLMHIVSFAISVPLFIRLGLD